MKGFSFFKHASVIALVSLALVSQACLKPTLKAKNASSTKATTVTLPTNGILVAANPIVITAFTVTVTTGSPMSGLTLADFTITNGTPAAFTTVNSTTYTFTVTPTAVGNVTISSPAGAATVTSSGVASLASNILVVNYDPSCTVSFTTTGATFNGLIATSGGTTTWNMNGAITTGTNTMAVNWGFAATRANSVKVDTGVNFTQVNNFQSQGISSISFSLGCNGMASINIIGNSISTIDLSMLSALTTLNLGDPWTPPVNANTMTSLDLSSNPLLTWVDVSHVPLTSLNVSNKPNLTFLRSHWQGVANPMTSLIFTNTPSLNTIYFTNSTINHFDFTANPLMNTIWLDANASLSSIDLSSNPVLSVFSCAECGLTALDVSNNTALTQLWLSGNLISTLNVTMLPSLSVLALGHPNDSIQHNLMTSLNLTGNPALTYFDMSWVPITSIDLSNKASVNFVRAYPASALTTLNLANTPALHDLYLSSSLVSSLNLTNSTALYLVYLASNPITAINLSGNPNLFQFTMTDSLVTTVNFTANTALTEINLQLTPSLTSVNITGLTALQRFNADSTSLASLNISTNTALVRVDVNNTTTFGSLTVGANTLLATMNFGNIGGLANQAAVLNSIYAQRAVLPVNSILYMAANGVPAAPELAKFTTLAAGPYFWTVTHD